MSLNSVPCFRNTFPAAKKRKKRKKIPKPLLRILSTYLGTGLNNKPEHNSNRSSASMKERGSPQP
jgi:hypothetical protein